MVLKNKWLLCMALFFLSSCNDMSAKIETVAHAQQWFYAHKNEVFSMQRELLAHPIIDRVEPSYRTPHEYSRDNNYEKFTDGDKAAYEAIEALCKQLNILNIAVNYSYPSNELISVKFLLYTPEFLGPKVMLSISYIPDAALLENFRNNKWIPHQLEEKDWYVIENLDP